MALLSRFWNPRPHKVVEKPVVTLTRMGLAYLHNDWAMVVAALVTFCCQAVDLVVPDGNQPGSNP